MQARIMRWQAEEREGGVAWSMLTPRAPPPRESCSRMRPRGATTPACTRSGSPARHTAPEPLQLLQGLQQQPCRASGPAGLSA